MVIDFGCCLLDYLSQADHLHMVVKAFLPRIIIPEKRFDLDVLSRIKITDLIIRKLDGEF